MAIFTFEQQAGRKLFTTHISKSPQSLSASELAALNDAAANAILIHLVSRHFPVAGLSVTYDLASATATITGVAVDRDTRAQIVECCGDIEGVGRVDERMALATVEEADSDTASSYDSAGLGNGVASGAAWISPGATPGMASLP